MQRQSISKYGLVFSGLLFLFLSCADIGDSPYDPSKTTISAVLKSSSITAISDLVYTDTTGSLVKIGVMTNLPKNIDSIRINIHSSPTVVDTIIYLKGIDTLASPDTLWRSTVFHVAGTKTIEVQAYITNGKIISTNVQIIIYPKLLVNKPPKWGKDVINLVGLTNAAIQLSLSDKCTDPDNDSLTFFLLPGLPLNDTIANDTFIFTPSAKDTGLFLPRITATDPKGASDTLTLHIIISSANKKPLFKTDMPKSFYSISEGALLSVPISATDADNDTVFFFMQSSATTLPHASTITLTKDMLTWQSQTSDTGNFKLGIGATDKKDTVFALVNVSIGNINRPPMWSHRFITAEVQEGKTLTLLLSDSCTDPDNDVIQYVLLTGLPASDSIINLNRYTYSPAYSDSGSYTIKISASDGKLADTLTIKLHVANVNRPPILTGVKDTTIIQGASIDFSVGAIDPDSDKVTLSTGALPLGATFNSATGAFHWAPASTVAGGTDITFSATDGILTANKKITITISSMPPPGITKDPISSTVCPGAADTFSVSATGSGTLSYQWKKNDSSVAGATNSVFIIASVTVEDSGPYSCVVSNPGGKTTSKAAKLSVNSLSTKPAANANPATVHFGDSSVLIVNSGTLGTGASWHWYAGSCGDTEVGAGVSIKVSPSTSTSYFARAEGGCASTSCSAAIPVTVQFAVSFDSKGGSAVAAQYVNSGEKAASPPAPTRTGYAFGGWYKESACTNVWTFTTDVVTSNITLYAKWTQVFTVTYNGNGNTGGSPPIDTNHYINGQNVIVLDNTSNLVKMGYDFSSWNTNTAGTGTARTPNTVFAMGASSDTLYAKWTIKTCVVTFNTQGGSTVSPQNIPYGSHATIPASPTLNNCIFSNWYIESQCFNQWNFSTNVIISDTTIYSGYTVTDIEGNIYKTILIGSQRWMSENLKTKKYRDGTAIPRITDSSGWSALSTPGYCWYGNDSAANNATYGILYNWYVGVDSRNIAPVGWHVPTDAEWDILQNFLITNGYNFDRTMAGNKVAKSMAFGFWVATTNPGGVGNDLSLNNKSGFSGLSGGLREVNGSFNSQGYVSEWWNVSDSGEGFGWNRGFHAYYPDLIRSLSFKREGFSVRLVKD